MRRSEEAIRQVSRRARALDSRLTPRWTRPQPRPVDRLLVSLSRAGEHSVLWLTLAAAGAVFGGSRGRRAAGDGVVALASTSAIVNGPLKLAVGRRRPPPRRRFRHRPRTSSFPSGHAACAFAFATAVSRDMPEAGPVLFPLAGTMAYSRVYLGLHYPSDVLAGAAFGTAVGLAVRPALRKLGVGGSAVRGSRASGVPTEAVLVVSPHSGNSRGLVRSRRELERYAIDIAEELDIQAIERLPELLRSPTGEARLVIAAGGDGTIGAVAGRLAGAENILGILPLGTGNDFARSLYISLNPRRAAKQLATGEISSVDLARLTREGQPPAYFAHAGSVGLNVDFAKLATRASVRARLGRLTYLAAAAYAVREHSSFTCALEHDRLVEELTLQQLAVISAPVIGGSLGLSLRSPYRDEHGLDVLAIENVPPWTLFRAGVFLLAGIKRPVAGVRAMHVDSIGVGSRNPLELALDGELNGSLPGRFETLPGALRVITPVSRNPRRRRRRR